MKHQTTIPNLILKEAQREDCPQILAYIMELAIYEKMQDQVETTVESLELALFQQRAAEAYIIELDEKPIGYILTTINFSTFVGRAGLYIEDIYITEKFRGNGYGQALFIELAAIAKNRNYGRIDWVCLDWNEPSHQFYLKMGASDLPEWVIHRLDEQGIQQLANKKQEMKK
jgi:Acetyltransferases, including N-acetylases of ribosomal proteins